MKIPKEPEPVWDLLKRLAPSSPEIAEHLRQMEAWRQFAKRCVRAFYLLRETRPDWLDLRIDGAWLKGVEGATVTISGWFYDDCIDFEFDVAEVERLCPDVAP